MRFNSAFLLWLLPVVAAAQTNSDDRQTDLLGRGALHVGMGTALGFSGGFGTTLRLSPRLQYFLRDGWSVALESRLETNGRQYQFAGGGLSTRYYFIRDQRLAVFAQAGATYGVSRFQQFYFNQFTDPFQRSVQPTWQVGLGAGVHYRLGNRWSVEGVFEHTLTRPAGFPIRYNTWQGNIGLNYRLSR